MAVHDFRKDPSNGWSFYVVDNLVTMANLYRYDTVQEAIEKYKSLTPGLKSAIGSSIGRTFSERHEIDHIHGIDGISVLIRDMDRVKTSLWRDSQEIAEAVELMRYQLHVKYELSGIFGSERGNVAIPVTDPNTVPDPYFKGKHLDPVMEDRPSSGINEVHTTGAGWVGIDKFLKDLDNRKWSPKTGYPVPFVNQLNIRYVDNRGRMGQADVTPVQFMFLRDDYIKSRERKPSLDEKITDASAKANRQADPGKGKDLQEREM